MTAGFLGDFCRSGLKAPQSSVLQGGGEMATGKAQRLSTPPSSLVQAGQSDSGGGGLGGSLSGGIWDG